MSSNTVNLDFFLAKQGVSWENIGITKPNTECIAGQASPPATPRPSSRSPTPRPSSSASKPSSSTSPTSGARQQAARSPIRKWSKHQGTLERRRYPTAPKSPFASTFHIQNSPTMPAEQRRQRTTDITRFRRYIKQRTYNLAEDAADKARAAADRAWDAYMEAERVARDANDAAERAEDAFDELQAAETTHANHLLLRAAPGAGDDKPPFEGISMDEFPEHESMLDRGANQIAAGFADLAYREFEGRSEAEGEISLQEAEDELRRMKKALRPLQRRDRAKEKAIRHARSLQAKGKEADVGTLQVEARKAAREVRRGSMNVQAAIRKVRADRWELKKDGEVETEKSRLGKYFA